MDTSEGATGPRPAYQGFLRWQRGPRRHPLAWLDLGLDQASYLAPL